MPMTKTTQAAIAVVVVIIIIVAAVGVYLVLDDDDDKEKVHIESSLSVYGNANGDYTIDAEDVAIIQDIIDGNATLSQYPLADADNNGRVNSTDLDIVNKIIAGEETQVVVIDQLDRVVTVSYPMKNVITGRSDATECLVVSGLDDHIVGYVGSDYTNVTEHLVTNGAVHLDTGTAISDASWAGIVSIDSSLYTKGEKIDAVIYDREGWGHEDDLAAAGIPVLCLRVTDPYQVLPATLLLAFLFGPEDFESVQDYVSTCEEALNYVTESVARIPNSSRVHFISLNMNYYVAGTQSQYTILGEAAGGICESQISGDGSTKMGTVEAITVYDNLITQMLNFSTQGLTTVDYTSTWWGNSNMMYLQSSLWYEDMVWINNSLPVVCRVVYAAAVMYPDVITMDYANGLFQHIVDNYMTYLHDTQSDGYFDVTKDMTTTSTYQDYLAWK